MLPAQACYLADVHSLWAVSAAVAWKVPHSLRRPGGPAGGEGLTAQPASSFVTEGQAPQQPPPYRERSYDSTAALVRQLEAGLDRRRGERDRAGDGA